MIKKNLEKSKNNRGLFKYKKLKTSIVKKLITDLSIFYGCDLEFLKEYSFYKSGSDKVYLFKGNLENIDPLRVNSIGKYFGTFHTDRFRLSIEGSKYIKPKQNFIRLNETSFKSYITAENLFENEVEEISREGICPFLIVIYEDESLGSASIKENNILTYMPKSRKLDYNRVF